jgi:hypothetical protein
MGHDSERAAIIYQHEARGADAAITMRSTLTWSPSRAREAMTVALLGPSSTRLMARGHLRGFYGPDVKDKRTPLTWDYAGAGDGNRTRTISLGS